MSDKSNEDKKLWGASGNVRILPGDYPPVPTKSDLGLSALQAAVDCALAEIDRLRAEIERLKTKIEELERESR